jgi:Eukaryotic-type carbonic anhydrase
MICQWRIEEEKVRSACGLDPVTPYGRCELFRNQAPTAEWLAEEAGQAFADKEPAATRSPATEPPFPETTGPPIVLKVGPVAIPATPVAAPVPVAPPTDVSSPVAPAPVPVAPPMDLSNGDIPPPIQCNAFNVNFERMCESKNPCCSSVRKDTTFCWESYEELGDAVESGCYHCCPTPMRVGPATEQKPNLPLTVTCSDVDNPHRMCKPEGCCTNPRSDTPYCLSIYDTYNDSQMQEVCHYCCSTSRDVGPSGRRSLRSEQSTPKKAFVEESIPKGARVFDVFGRRFVLGQENFEPSETDEQAHFDRMYADHKRRSLQVSHAVNYEDIEWFPYEWLMKVGTEYYFRYEGTMLIPPCWETVHWRVMKDPIVVHSRQIAEINRLLAWRLNPNTCEVETAGVLSDDGNTVNMAREVQYMHKQHRQVFCECKDWPSKFESDKQWCDNWEDDKNYDRFYRRPYSFDSGGQWAP